MADTYTARNRFLKPEPGQHLNTWGAENNAGFGSNLLDSALDGVESYTLSGPKTLTSTNATDSEAIQRVQNITGGAGGTITIPSVEKNYIVRNAATGNVIITTGGGATATILPGNIAQVFCDSTNVYLGMISDYGSVQLKSSATASGPTHLVNKALLDATAFNAALPNQAGNTGKYVTTDGTTASWTAILSTDVTGALGYTPTSVTGLTGVQSVSAFKTGLSLDNVTNTSDANKPVSSAQQTALNLKLDLAGGTLTGPLITVASGTGAAGFRIPHGTAPTSPTNGDIWTTSGGVFVRVGGSTQQLALAGDWVQIDSKASTSGSNVDFAPITQTYSGLLLVLLGVSTSSGSNPTLSVKVSGDGGSTFSTTGHSCSLGMAAADVLYGAIQIPGYRKDAGMMDGIAVNLGSDQSMGTASNINPTAWRLADGIDGLRVALSTGSFDAGTIILYGKL